MQASFCIGWGPSVTSTTSRASLKLARGKLVIKYVAGLVKGTIWHLNVGKTARPVRPFAYLACFAIKVRLPSTIVSCLLGFPPSTTSPFADSAGNSAVNAKCTLIYHDLSASVAQMLSTWERPQTPQAKSLWKALGKQQLWVCRVFNRDFSESGVC